VSAFPSLVDLLQVLVLGGAGIGGTVGLLRYNAPIAEMADNAGRGAILGSLGGTYVAFTMSGVAAVA
jgi:hypothetical protein